MPKKSAKTTSQLSDEQFHSLIENIRTLIPPSQQAGEEEKLSKGSFANCTIRFTGRRDNDAVEVFLDAIETYKEVEQISDKDAVSGISLLLTDLAATWWKGVRREAKTWDDTIRLLREHFSPTKPSYQIYLEIFEHKQEDHEAIDTFICTKRALLAKLPEGRHDEECEIDFIYGLLAPRYRQQIARHEIKSFRTLSEKGRVIERNWYRNL